MIKTDRNRERRMEYKTNRKRADISLGNDRLHIDPRYNTSINKKTFAVLFSRKMDELGSENNISFYFNPKSNELSIEYENEMLGQKETVSQPFYKFMTTSKRFSYYFEESNGNYKMNENAFPETKYDIKSVLKESGIFDVSLSDVVEELISSNQKIKMNISNLFDSNLFREIPNEEGLINSKRSHLLRKDYNFRESRSEVSNYAFDVFHQKYMNHRFNKEMNPFDSLDIISNVGDYSMYVYYRNPKTSVDNFFGSAYNPSNDYWQDLNNNCYFKKDFEIIPSLRLVKNNESSPEIIYDGDDIVEFTDALLDDFTKSMSLSQNEFGRAGKVEDTITKLFTIDYCKQQLGELERYFDLRNIDSTYNKEVPRIKENISKSKRMFLKVSSRLIDSLGRNSKDEDAYWQLDDEFIDQFEKLGYNDLEAFLNDIETDFSEFSSYRIDSKEEEGLEGQIGIDFTSSNSGNESERLSRKDIFDYTEDFEII